MILVTLGTQDKNFVRLLEKIDQLINNGLIKDKVIVQAGFTKYNSATISLVARFKIESYNSGVAYIFGNPEGAGSGLALVNGKPTYEVFYSSNSRPLLYISCFLIPSSASS